MQWAFLLHCSKSVRRAPSQAPAPVHAGQTNWAHLPVRQPNISTLAGSKTARTLVDRPGRSSKHTRLPKASYNYSRTTVKSGKVRGVQFEMLEKICEALDCRPGDVVEYRPEQTRLQKINA
jgi:Cro/C1-type HTH DNA-binding domain